MFDEFMGLSRGDELLLDAEGGAIEAFVEGYIPLPAGIPMRYAVTARDLSDAALVFENGRAYLGAGLYGEGERVSVRGIAISARGGRFAEARW
jgi:hypothetical protein